MLAMSSIRPPGYAMLMLLAGLSLGANAQTPPPPAPSESGLGEQAKKPADVDPGQNMILPSAGQAGPSAAPTMVYDCKAKPQDCTPPAQAGDKASAPQLSAPPATSGPKQN